MTKLAILGGESLIDKQLKPYRSIGPLEIKAVEETMRTGVISGFYGDFCNEFWGGPKVNEFENTWASRFDVRHAVTVNSATSALYAAIGAIGISPGDEVIVPPYTMSATVMAPIVYGGIPVFADIESDTFGLDPESVRQAITSKTKAILTVNLFGHTSQLDELMDIAKQTIFTL